MKGGDCMLFGLVHKCNAVCRRYKAYTVFPLRLALGAIFIVHGGQKLFGWFDGFGISGTASFFSSLGIAPAVFWAWVVAMVEFFGGVCILLGLLTELAALLIFIDMFVALVKVHAPNGFFVNEGGYEFVLLIMAACLTLMARGAGIFSVDKMVIDKKEMAGQSSHS